jgi:hypothetical protein
MTFSEVKTTMEKQPPYLDWNDIENKIRLHNGSEWIEFDLSSPRTAEQKLSIVRELLKDPGIDKDQISTLLAALDDQ